MKKSMVQKSERLLIISKFANGLSWLIIMPFIFVFMGEMYSIVTSPYSQIIFSQKRSIFQFIIVLVEEIEFLFIGIALWLILKGIHLGLLVIVNIDKNIGIDAGIVPSANTKTNRAFEPETIIRFSGLLNKAAILSIFLSILTSIVPINYLYEIVQSFFIGRPDLIHSSWIITSILSTFCIGLQSTIYYVFFKSFGLILLLLLDMDNILRKKPKWTAQY